MVNVFSRFWFQRDAYREHFYSLLNGTEIVTSGEDESEFRNEVSASVTQQVDARENNIKRAAEINKQNYFLKEYKTAGICQWHYYDRP